IAAPAMVYRAFAAGFGCAKERQNTPSESLPGAGLVAKVRFHQNAGCAEQPLVSALKIDGKAAHRPAARRTNPPGSTWKTHEVRPFKDTGRRGLRRPRPVCCPLAASGWAKVEVRVHCLFDWAVFWLGGWTNRAGPQHQRPGCIAGFFPL